MDTEEKFFLTLEFQLISVKGMTEIFKNNYLATTTEILKAKNHQWMLKSSIKIKYLHSQRISPTEYVLITREENSNFIV